MSYVTMTHGVEKSLTAPVEKNLFRHIFVDSPILNKKENGNFLPLDGCRKMQAWCLFGG